MTHGISEQQWMDYLEGNLAVEVRAQLEEHVASCAECSRSLGELRAWRERLQEEGARLQGVLELPEPEMERMLAASLERIQSVRPGALSLENAIMALGSLIEPILGRGTVRAATDLGRRRAADWPGFVAAMSDGIAAVCGLAAGRLVTMAGASLAVAGVR
jgi:anti-sigma factor RsiW